MSKLLVGNCLLAFFSKYTPIFSQDPEDESSLLNILNNMSVHECTKQLPTIVDTITLLPEFEQFRHKVSKQLLSKLVTKAIVACKNANQQKLPYNVSNRLVGNNFFHFIARYIEVPDDTKKCCSLRKTLNIYGPQLTNDCIRMMIEVIKSDALYKANNFDLSIRTLYLLLRKAIRMTGVDMGKLRRYNFPRTPRTKEPNDATSKR